MFVVIPFILDARLVDAPAGVTQQEGRAGFLHLPSAVLALILIARRIQPSPFPLSTVEYIEFCVFVGVLSSYLFWTSDLWTYQPGSHRQEEGHTGFLNLPSCLDFSREKDSAVSFSHRPWSRILCTNELNLSPLELLVGRFFCFCL